MDETGKKLLNLMFRSGETICVSPNKYGYHSVPLESALSESVNLVPPDPRKPIETYTTDKLLMVALNPIHGQREDVNCLKFRNFLVEIDTGSLKEQLEYIKKIDMPYSAIVFSGNKSMHFLISLDQDIPDESKWRILSEWILGVVTNADQNTKNPSRSIRMPGAYREPGKKQRLVEFKGPVSIKELSAWLSKYPNAKPQKQVKRGVSKDWDLTKIRYWAKQRLVNGLDPTQGRNKQWFSIACEFALAGFSEDDTMDILAEFFSSERDFKEREWKTSIKSAFKYIHNRR